MNKTDISVKTSVAIEHFGGSRSQLAAFFGIAPSAIYQWGEFVPQVRAFQLRESFPHLVVKPEREKSNAA